MVARSTSGQKWRSTTALPLMFHHYRSEQKADSNSRAVTIVALWVRGKIRAAKCFTALTTHTASLQPSDLSAPPDSWSPQQPVCKRRRCCLLSDAPSSGFYSVAECKSAQTHTENTRPVGRGSSTTLQPPSLAMHNAWEHVNTLFRTCINDHGEAHSLSTRAINKRWCTDKGPYLPVLRTSSPPTNHLIRWDTFHANS